MNRASVMLAAISAALIMATPCLADPQPDPHLDVSAIHLGGGLIQYTILLNNPLGRSVAATVTAQGNFNQIDATVPVFAGGSDNLDPVSIFTLSQAANFFDPNYNAMNGPVTDSYWDNTDLSVANPPFTDSTMPWLGGSEGGEVGSTVFSYSAGSAPGSDIFNTRLGQLVVFDAAAASLPLGPLPVVDSGLAPLSFVDVILPFGRQSHLSARGLNFDVNGSFAVEPILPPLLSVDLDIKPLSDPNSINLKSRGVLPVAILTTGDFDALTVDVETILFGDPVLLGNGGMGVAPLRSGEEDVNGDGLTDLSLKFSMSDLVAYGALGGLSMEAMLTGLTFDGVMFGGSDSVRLVPPGDANNDQIVNAADYTIWANNFDSKGAKLSDGDFNEDRKVDAADYTMWANNFGTDLSAPGSATSAVPEPSTFVLSALGLIGLLTFGWRRRSGA